MKIFRHPALHSHFTHQILRTPSSNLGPKSVVWRLRFGEPATQHTIKLILYAPQNTTCFDSGSTADHEIPPHHFHRPLSKTARRCCFRSGAMYETLLQASRHWWNNASSAPAGAILHLWRRLLWCGLLQCRTRFLKDILITEGLYVWVRSWASGCIASWTTFRNHADLCTLLSIVQAVELI